ncbi:hypothetical protein CHUAL_009575 [Chamberlinius hualienensis]
MVEKNAISLGESDGVSAEARMWSNSLLSSLSLNSDDKESLLKLRKRAAISQEIQDAGVITLNDLYDLLFTQGRKINTFNNKLVSLGTELISIKEEITTYSMLNNKIVNKKKMWPLSHKCLKWNQNWMPHMLN